MAISLKPQHLNRYRQIAWLFIKYGRSDLVKKSGLDETLEGVERVTSGDIQRVARDLFSDGALAATVLGAVNGLELPRERLSLG